MSGSLVGAVDLGGTTIVVGVGTGGAPLATRTVATDAHQGADAVVARAVEALRATQAEADVESEQLAAVGVAVPGPLDAATGIVLDAHNLGWRDYPLAARLGEALGGVPVRIEDDANLAGLGEARFGAGAAFGDQVYVTVSTGIGGAVILGGRVHTGHRGLAGEVGHICVVPDGPRCGCGRLGCLEAVAAGPAIARRGAAVVATGAAPVLRALADERGGDITSALVFEAARAGDAACLEIVDEAAGHLALLLATIVQVLDPEAIVLGGGVMRSADLLLPAIERRIAPHLHPLQRSAVAIVPARLGELSGLYGALDLAMQGGADGRIAG